MTTKLYKQLNNPLKQNTTVLTSSNSQELTESDTNVSSVIEIETETTTSSSTESTNTSSSSNPTTSKPTASSNTTTSKPITSNTSTNITTGTTTELDMLACVIYQEAGGNGSCDTCRRRVADVVLNRVADSRFPNTIKEVLTAKNQYGRFHYTGIVWPSRSKNAGEQAAVARAYRIAEEVLNGHHSDLYGKGYIWQAGFKQGSSNIYCCGTYFGK